MMVEDIKKEFNNSFKEIQENTAKQVEELKEEAQKNPLKNCRKTQPNRWWNWIKPSKTLKVDSIKKNQSEATLEIENLGKKSGTIDASISNRIQEMEERISGTEDSIENIGTTIKENGKCKKILTQNIQKIQDTMRRPNLRTIGIEESEES